MKRTMRSAMMLTTYMVPTQSLFEMARAAPTQRLQQEIARMIAGGGVSQAKVEKAP